MLQKNWVWHSVNLANLKIIFTWLFFEEIKFAAMKKSLMQVSPCAAHMQKFHASYMHSSFLCHL